MTTNLTTAKRPGIGRFLPWLIGVGVVAVLVAAPTLFNATQQARPPGEAFPDLGNAHVAEGDTSAAYNSVPPTSGPHWEPVAGWDSYDFVVPDQVLLHNLEDGGVVLWYAFGSPEQNQARIAQLEPVARGFERVIIAPRGDLTAPFAATAWGRRQLFERVDPDAMRAFIEAFEGVDHHG